MDREHPIPQEVSTYEFRLVGDMTIKQFMQVAAGALIALVLYSSNIAPYVKWPLIIVSFLSGVALAFFPIEDRPLSKWIVLFVKAIYSPTVYTWNKNARKYEFFQPENIELQTPGAPTPAIPTVAAVPLPTTLNPAVSAEDLKLDKKEEEILSTVNKQFESPTPTVEPIDKVENIAPLTNLSIDSNLPIPKNPDVTVEKSEKPILPPETSISDQNTTGQVSPIAKKDFGVTKAATFSEDASPPSPATRPNVVVGQILDSQGKIVDGAILEIKDKDGRSVRALRSNRLGHFLIVTPLADGQYTITVEKEGLSFEPVSVEAKDQIIPPIAIWAKQN